MSNYKNILIQNETQMQLMKSSLQFQNYLLKDSSFEFDDYTQDIIIQIDEANKIAYMIPSKEIFEDPENIVVSTSTYLNQINTYRLKNSVYIPIRYSVIYDDYEIRESTISVYKTVLIDGDIIQLDQLGNIKNIALSNRNEYAESFYQNLEYGFLSNASSINPDDLKQLNLDGNLILVTDSAIDHVVGEYDRVKQSFEQKKVIQSRQYEYINALDDIQRNGSNDHYQQELMDLNESEYHDAVFFKYMPNLCVIDIENPKLCMWNQNGNEISYHEYDFFSAQAMEAIREFQPFDLTVENAVSMLKQMPDQESLLNIYNVLDPEIKNSSEVKQEIYHKIQTITTQQADPKILKNEIYNIPSDFIIDDAIVKFFDVKSDDLYRYQANSNNVPVLEDNKAYKFKVYVGTHNNYACGDLKGHWLTLPVSDDELQNFLEDSVGINLYNAEPMILNWDNDIFNIGTSDITLVNEAAKIWDKMLPHQQEACIAYSQANSISDAKALCNVFLQCDDIPYYSYDFDGIENCEHLSNFEKLGYTLADNFRSELEQLSIGDSKTVEMYFNYEQYGRDAAKSGIRVYDQGYLDDSISIDLSKYSYDEICEYNLDIDQEIYCNNMNDNEIDQNEIETEIDF